MATRTILTSQPVLVCDVCARSLLRGEQHDIFLEGGQPRTVCELCAPRAAQEGWLRERDGELQPLTSARRMRGRSFIERLRELARPGVGDAQNESVAPSQESAAARPRSRPRAAPRIAEREDESLTAVNVEQHDSTGGGAEEPAEDWLFAEPQAGGSAITRRAADTFNASEFPRRIAGLTRSLGPPTVNVRVAEHLDSAVRIVVSWELCWYRYEVDFSEDPVVMKALSQGSELEQLERDELIGNASISDLGELEVGPHA